MSPLDDQLRAALHGRAATLAPSPDPLAGIESKARGIRRRRVAASVAGAALAVAAIAVGVPALTGDRHDRPTQFATNAPTAVTSSAALDAEHPWAFRGTPLAATTLAAFQHDWAALHSGSTLTPLFAQVYEPSGMEEAAFVATDGDGPRYGFVTRSAAGTNFRYDEALPGGTNALAFALAGDEVPRLLVVAAPSSQRVLYAADGTSYTDITPHVTPVDATRQPYQGIGIVGLQGDPSKDRVRVTGADGTVVYDEPAPDLPRTSEPTNVLDWPSRGTEDGALLSVAGTALAPSLQAPPATVVLRALFTGQTASGVHYVVGEAFERGSDTAYSFAYSEGGTNGPAHFLGPAINKDAALLAFDLSNLPGTSRELLVVVPAPRTAQVLYDDNGTGAFRPVTDTPGTDGVALIDRTAGATSDRLQLLTGNGDPAKDVTFEGPVVSLLCRQSGCG